MHGVNSSDLSWVPPEIASARMIGPSALASNIWIVLLSCLTWPGQSRFCKASKADLENLWEGETWYKSSVAKSRKSNLCERWGRTTCAPWRAYRKTGSKSSLALSAVKDKRLEENTAEISVLPWLIWASCRSSSTCMRAFCATIGSASIPFKNKLPLRALSRRLAEKIEEEGWK